MFVVINNHVLQGSGGNFPQVCLYDAGAQLLGYTDTNIKIQHSKFQKVPTGQHHNKFESPRPEGMPDIQNGGLQAVGVWPLKGRERDLGTQQAPYLLLIKRHYDAICVASVFVKWPDSSTWILCVFFRHFQISPSTTHGDNVEQLADNPCSCYIVTAAGPANPTSHGTIATSTMTETMRYPENAFGSTTEELWTIIKTGKKSIFIKISIE